MPLSNLFTRAKRLSFLQIFRCKKIWCQINDLAPRPLVGTELAAVTADVCLAQGLRLTKTTKNGRPESCDENARIVAGRFLRS